MTRASSRLGATLGFTLALALLPGFVSAQEAEDADDSRFSVGFQSSWPSYGLSVRYDLSDKLQAQGVLGALGTLTNFSGRLNYAFQDKEKFDIYGYGSVGFWRYSYDFLGAGASETSIGAGGGAGLEFDLQELIAPEDGDFPSLYASLELGLTLASFDFYNWSAFGIGAGFHYHF